MSFRSVVRTRVIDRRLVLCALLIVVACGKRRDGGGDGDGTAIGSGSAVLTLPTDTQVPVGLAVTVKPSTLPAVAERYSKMVSEHFAVVAVVDVAPAAAKLANSGRLAITIDPARIPKGHSTADVTAVQLQPENTIVDLSVRVFGPQRLDVTTDHGGTVLLLAPLENLKVIGASSQVVRGSSALLMKGDCASWITAGSPRVAALAKAPEGLVIGPDHSLTLGAKLEVGAASPDLLHADQLLERGVADSSEASVVLASLLLAKGSSVRLVSGSMTYDLGGVRHAGVQQWAEVVLEGAPWFIDARDVAKPRLVPLADATKELSLVIARACAAYPPGVARGPGQWDPPTPK